MKQYLDIKKKNADNLNTIMDQHQVFWAFSQEQLEQGKAKIGITDNKELTSIGMGGFLPKAKADGLFLAIEQENKRYRKELRAAKEAKEQAIAYELSNHEAYYTGDIQPVVELFAGLYTAKDIQAVYLKQSKKR